MNWIKIIKCDLGYSLCFIYFDVIIHQWPKKKFKLVDVWSCATTDTGDASRATFSRLMENHYKNKKWHNELEMIRYCTSMLLPDRMIYGCFQS